MHSSRGAECKGGGPLTGHHIRVGDGSRRLLKPRLGSIVRDRPAYEAAHPNAEATLYRHNSAAIRLRVIDRRFEGRPKSRRHADVWDFLAARVPEDILADVSLVLAIAPAELAMSLANVEFESPIASMP